MNINENLCHRLDNVLKRFPNMESLDTPLHNPDYAEISSNSKSEIIPEGKKKRSSLLDSWLKLF